MAASDDSNERVGPVPSPCVRNCCLDYDEICMGCYRSLSEICAWHEASDAEKLATLARCRARHKERQERKKDA